MNPQPKVSIVIPVYNGANFIREAIDSALAQTYSNIEIVVVNDGSRDEGATERILLSYGDRIRYFSKENGGVASALNRAIVEMTGEYFSWLSHDDLYYPNKIATQIHALAEMDHANTILYSDYAIFSDNPDMVQEICLPSVSPEQFRYFLTIANSLHGCTLLIPREAFAACGTFDEKLRTTQDYDLWFRLAEKFRFVHIPAVLVKGRQHEAQGSITMKDAALVEINALLSGFAGDLSPEELTAAKHKSVSLAYAEISASFGRRRFYLAARHAIGLSLNRLGDGTLVDAMETILMLLRGVVTCALFGWARWLKRLMKIFGTGFTGFKRMFGRIINKLLQLRVRNLQDKFSLIYSRNIFGGKESRSGEGSDMLQTAEIRRVLPELIQALHVQTFLDAPCGDLFWMRATKLGVKKYIGVDIVEELVEKKRREFCDEAHEFLCRDLAQDELPFVDMIFCRDCLVHLNFADVKRVLLNFKRSGSLYLLTTTFPWRDKNVDLVGKVIWRTLNLQVEPFNFPPPLQLINEKCSESNGAYADKSLGLWRLSDIETDWLNVKMTC